MNAGESVAPPAPLTRKQVLVVFSGLLLAMLLAALDSTIVATALPTIVGELGGLDRLAWVVTAYLLAQTIASPLYGKLGDLYGRKIVLQTGILIFLLGSVLCGMSGSMGQLILYRFIQGLGGGGLMVTTQAVVGDIVPPRERGRYQGIFGAVFGVSSIAGPLIGGYFTTELSWRWIFYINVPLGALALGVIAVTLPRRPDRVKHAIDYLGTALLATTLSALVLLMDLGGNAYTWNSPVILALGAVVLASLGGFLVVEARASEPVLPLRLFANQTFAVTSAIGLVVGVAMFGSVTYLPLFLQVVNGATPTGSGLQMVPMMGGMLVTSIGSGQLISRWGRYKVFPIAGTAVMALGLFMLSRMNSGTSVLQASVNMLILGLGLGLVMQVLVIAVQNAVEYRDLGVATSGTTLFRLVGGSLGTAVFGAIFASRLATNLAVALPGSRESAIGTGITPEMLLEMAPGTRVIYVDAFTQSLSVVFLAAMGVTVIGFFLTWLIPERPLRETISAMASDLGREAEDLFPMPSDASSVFRLERALSLLANRDVKREYVVHAVERAGVDLTPLAAWILVKVHEDAELDMKALSRTHSVEYQRLGEAADELFQRGLIETSDGKRDLTAHGCEVLERLVVARREHLAEIVAEWAPQKREEIAAMLQKYSRDLVPDAPKHR